MGYLRFLLAFAVICAHAGGVFGYDITGGRFAVEAFFMISGFLMQLVLSKKYDPHHDKKAFYVNRLLRIYPTYLFSLGFALVVYGMCWAGNADFRLLITERMADVSPLSFVWIIVTHITIIGQEAFLFLAVNGGGLQFWPHGVDGAAWPLMAIPPAWSISLELLFYIVAPLAAVMSSRRLAIIVGVCLAAKVATLSAGLNFDPWTHRFLPFELSFFILGMLSYRAQGWVGKVAPRFKPNVAVALAIAGTLCVHPATIVFAKIGLSPELLSLLYAALIFVVLPSLAAFSTGREFDGRLGALSYPMYLLHWPIIVAFNVFIPGPEGIWWGTVRTIVCSLLAIAISQLVVSFLEERIERFRRRISDRVQSERHRR